MTRFAALTFALPLLWLIGGSPAAPSPDAHPSTGGATPAEAPAPAPVEIREWEVPYEASRPRDPYVGPDGDVYFVGQRTHYIARLDPESGEFTKWELEDGTGPHNLIVDDGGIVWYAGNRAGHIGRLDPESGEIQKFPMPGCGEGDPDMVSELPECQVRDPHTLIFDGSGGIWFTAQGANVIGHFDPTTGDVHVSEVPTERARPYGIVTDENGRPWVAMVGTYKLATVDPETFELTEIPLPREEANPRRIGLTSDGGVWYVDYSQGYVGRYDPETGEFQEWQAPSAGEARPYAMTVDDEDRIWFVETGPEPNRFVGFDPETEEFFDITPVPSGGGTVRHMMFHAPTGSIWFGADTNTIGRVQVP